MTDKDRYFLLLATGFTLLGADSCTQERQLCLTPKVAIMNMQTVHFSDSTLLTVVDTALPAAVIGALPDSVKQLTLYNTGSLFSLSLSPAADSCKWLVTTDSLKYSYDTLTFYYQRNLEFLSNACGYTCFYTIKTVSTTHNNIDSVQITNTNVTNDVKTKHLRVFFHPNF